MAQAEGSFKVCGLCSQLVDESVKLPDDLLNHLIVFLNVAGDLLPSKICTDCFQGATESKKFKVGTYLKGPSGQIISAEEWYYWPGQGQVIPRSRFFKFQD
jgi:hypothetical protein